MVPLYPLLDPYHAEPIEIQGVFLGGASRCIQNVLEFDWFSIIAYYTRTNKVLKTAQKGVKIFVE